MNYRRLKLAVNATRLTKLAYNSMLEKLKAGRASSFDLVIADDRLRTTQLSELSAVIVYLNTITDLEKTMGVTLEHWSITINDKNVNEEFRRYLSEK
jgi:outer membrane protein TolC